MAVNPDINSTFAGNPLIQAIGSRIGLDDMFSSAEPQAAKPGASKPSPAESRDFPTAQLRLMRMMQANQSGARGGGGMAMPQQPGVMSQDTLQNPMVGNLLQHFGVNPNVQVDPHLFLHNPDAWAKHPVLSGMLEGALSGAAFTHGSNTVGEGISNVAQGMLQSQAAHAEHINNQLMMPFQQAQAVGALQNMQGDQDQRQAMVDEAKSHADYFNAMANAKPDTINPLYDLQNHIIQQRTADFKKQNNGQDPTGDQLESIYQGLQNDVGEGHHAGQLENPMNTLLGDAGTTMMQKLHQQYGDNIPPEALQQATFQVLGDIARAKWQGHPGAAGAISTMRGSMIQDANDQIKELNDSVRQAGAGYIYKGKLITAADLADLKNRIVGKLNVQLGTKKLPPLSVNYTAQGTAPTGKSTAPATDAQTQSSALPPQAAAQLKAGVHTRFGNGQVWTLDANGNPQQISQE